MVVNNTEIIATIYDKISSFSNLAIAILTLVIVLIAYFQLKNLAKSNILDTVLKLEIEINRKKAEVDRITTSIRMLEMDGKQNNDTILILSDELDAALENYFNILDRLSYCIIKKYLPERDWKIEYQELIKDAVEHNEDKFGIASSFKNIKNIFEKWN